MDALQDREQRLLVAYFSFPLLSLVEILINGALCCVSRAALVVHTFILIRGHKFLCSKASSVHRNCCKGKKCNCYFPGNLFSRPGERRSFYVYVKLDPSSSQPPRSKAGKVQGGEKIPLTFSSGVFPPFFGEEEATHEASSCIAFQTETEKGGKGGVSKKSEKPKWDGCP